MKLKRFLCFAVCFSMLISVNSFCSVSANEEYVQKVELTQSMYTAKEIYVDDDFNDRTVNSSVASSDYTKKIAGAASAAIAAKDKETDINLYAASSSASWSSSYITLLNKNNIQSDKLALSFKYRINNTDYKKNLYFRLYFGSKPLMMFQRTDAEAGIIKLYSSDSTSSSICNTPYNTTEWINVNIIFEKVLTDGGYKPQIKQMYVKDTALDMNKISTILGGTPQFYDGCSDWWSDDSLSISLGFVGNSGIQLDDIMLYEPYDFSVLNILPDESENSVKVTFTQGVSELAPADISLSSNGITEECEKILDSADPSKRTVLITPKNPLDLSKNIYELSVSNASNFNNTANASSSLVFGKKNILAQQDGYFADGSRTGKYVFPNQNISGKVTLTNLTDEEKTVMAVSAYYENGKLKSIGNIDKQTIPANTADESVTLESSLKLSNKIADNGELKTFVFESNLKPVIKAYQKQVIHTDSIKLFLIGDSICDDSYSLEQSRRGWGGFIGDYFGDNVTVVNHGHSGYTIKNFMDGDGWKDHDGQTCSWENIKNELTEGDVVMLSLGINDNAKIEKGEYTWEYYQSSLETVINGAREKGADVVLVTSTPNSYAYNQAKDSFSNSSYNTPREKMMETALKNNVPCFDLNTALKEKLNEFLEKGWTVDNILPAYTLDESGKMVYVNVGTEADPQRVPSVIYQDLVHHTREGSRLNAKLIADYLKSSQNDLISFMEEPEAPVGPAENLLGDYSFENGNAPLRAVAGGSIKYDSDISRSGKQSVMFKKSGIWSGLGIGDSDTYLLDLIKQNGAGRYHFEAYVRPGTYFTSNNYVADVSIKFVDSTGATVSPTEFEIAPVAAPMRTGLTEKATKWEKVSLDFNIDDLQELTDKDIAKIQLYVSAGIGRGTIDDTQSIWVDDAVLCKYDRGTKIVLIGDSVCTSGSSNVGQIGWGAYINSRIDSSKAYVNNTAVGGHNLLDYINGDEYGQSWEKLSADLKAGDYVFVSLGINDEIKITGSNNEGYTWDLYKHYLTQIITDAKSRGANVLLITPTANGKEAYNESTSSFDNSQRAAVKYMKEVAESTGTPCFDLNQALRDEMNNMLKAGKTKDEVIEYFHVADATHLNTQGALYVSNLIMDYVSKSELGLKNVMVK